jgi:hypothetical protein
MTCEVMKEVHSRGYGTREEVVPVTHSATEAWSFDITRYINVKPIEKKKSF